MTLSLDSIPTVRNAPAEAPRTSIKPTGSTRTNRRTLLRGITLGAVTIGATVASFSDRLTRPAVAGARTAPSFTGTEPGPGGLKGYVACPEGRPWGGHANTDVLPNTPHPRACTGLGGEVGKTWCDAKGWHKTGYTEIDHTKYTMDWPVSDLCGNGGSDPTINSWRWKPSKEQGGDGNTYYRCSDGYTAAYRGNAELYEKFSLCQGSVS
jgi:hypothetical protein